MMLSAYMGILEISSRCLHQEAKRGYTATRMEKIRDRTR